MQRDFIIEVAMEPQAIRQLAALLWCAALSSASPRDALSGMYHPPGSGWVNFYKSDSVSLNGYVFTRRPRVGEANRQIWVEGGSLIRPRKLFVEDRELELTVIPGSRLILINSAPATKSVEVWVSSLDNGKCWRIDAPAVKAYKKDVPTRFDLIVMPEAAALSPNGSLALIVMQLIHAAKPVRSFTRHCYAVDTSNGEIRREFADGRIPREWWNLRAR